MAKLQLKQAPTFTAKVGIPVPGARPEKVEFTFRNKTREELAAWMDSLEGKKTDEAVLEIASGWDLEDPFDADSVRLLLSNYIGAWQAICETYMQELLPAKAKN